MRLRAINLRVAEARFRLFSIRRYSSPSSPPSSKDRSHEALEGLTPHQAVYIKKWQRLVESGEYAGTYDAWILETNCFRKQSLAAPYISTLSLDKALESNQYLKLIKNGKDRCSIQHSVLVNGSNVGVVTIYMPTGSCKPAELVMMYYDKQKGLLRFMRRDGEHLPPSADVDLVAEAGQKGVRPLLQLAHAEGLIKQVPSGRFSSLDFQSNLDSGFYTRANMASDGNYWWLCHSLVGTLGQLEGYPPSLHRLSLRLSGQQKSTIRFFPYVHDDDSLRLWDIDAKEDLKVVVNESKGSEGMPPSTVKKRAPWLYQFARSLGYWKEPISFEFSSLDFQSNLDSGFSVFANRDRRGGYCCCQLSPSGFAPQMAKYNPNARRFQFRILGQQKPTVRFFPYIPADGNLRLWDVDENQEINLNLQKAEPSGGLPPLAVRKRAPWLFEFAQSLGYWKGLS